MNCIYRLTAVVIIVLCIVSQLSAQVGGTYHYALGSSAVMRNGDASALFLNPGELARIHSRELYVGTHRFTDLPTFSAARFFPSLGTFAMGVSNEGGYSQYSLGFGSIIYDRQTIGGSVNYVHSPVSDDVTVSLGATWHIPESQERNSGILLGASVLNFSSNTDLPGQRYMAGAGYWILPDKLSLQGGLLYEAKESKAAIGAEYLLARETAIQAGSVAFEDFSAGISHSFSAMKLFVGVGQQGISLGVNFRFGEDPVISRDNYYEQGIKAYDRGDYPESNEAFAKALAYDEYFEAARTYVGLSSNVTETANRILFREAQDYEKEGNLLEAKKNYMKILKGYPDDVAAKSRLMAMQPALREKSNNIASTADSLMRLKKFEAAREKYLLSFEYDSENEIVLEHLSTMEKLIADSVVSLLAKGTSLLEKNQIEQAQSAFNDVLRYNPGNPEAKKNLAAIDARIKANSAPAKQPQRSSKEIFDRAKSAFDNQNYFDAIYGFTEVLKQDPKNKDAQSYIDRARTTLLPQIEGYFKTGLQHYVEENYAQALEIWNKALIIKPDHQAILEYKKRAELKIEALERLK